MNRIKRAHSSLKSTEMFVKFISLFCIGLHIISSNPVLSQIFTEDFESGSGGYATTISECTDGSEDYFKLTDGSDINATFSNVSGSYFAAQDVDGAPCTGSGTPMTESITWSGINISGCSSLSFSIDFAEDDDGSNEDWDAPDYVHVYYTIDGGAEQNLIWIENDGSAFNSAPFIDTDFDGTGDGAEITDAFTTFTQAIAGTGTTIDIRIEISLNSGDEDIAFDNLELTGSCSSNTITTSTVSPLSYTVDCSSGQSGTVDFTSAGTFNGGNIFTAELSDASGSFAAPTSIGTLTASGSAPSGTINFTIPAGTASGTGYRIRVVSSDPNVTGSDNGTDITINSSGAPCSSTGFGCPSGSIGVTGSGCGCLSGCDLSALDGPDCGSGVGGNCDAGYVPMSLEIDVPEGCTYTVDAEMMPRTDCSAAGADGNCATCDALKVDILGGSKGMQFGPSNASLSDSYTLVGPGTIRISGSANRADEIITYQVSSSGSTCPSCTSILPIELLEFDAEREKRYVHLTWETGSEKNNDYFTVERSADGISFTPIGNLSGAGNSTNIMSYKLIDSSPILDKISYYRLKQTDFDGTYTYSDIVSVKPNTKTEIIGYYNTVGQRVPSSTKGIIIIRYSDGTTKKVFQ